MGKSAVLICPLFLVEYEFEMVALCRGTEKLLSTILIIFFYQYMSVGYMGLFWLISDALLISCLPGSRESR